MASESFGLLNMRFYGTPCLEGGWHKKFGQIECQPSLYIGIIGLSLIFAKKITIANFLQDYRKMAPLTLFFNIRDTVPLYS